MLPAGSTATQPTARPRSIARKPSRTMAIGRRQQWPSRLQRSRPQLLNHRMISRTVERPQHPGARHANHLDTETIGHAQLAAFADVASAGALERSLEASAGWPGG